MNTDNIEKEVTDQAKKICKVAGKLLLKALKPYLPIIIVIILIFLMVVAIIAGVYSAFPVTNDKKNLPILAGVKENQIEDAALKKNYLDLCNRYNVKDTWVVNSEAIGPENGNAYESSPGSPFYPGRGTERTGALLDSYGNDQKLRLLWGQVHAATLYDTYANNLPQITADLQENVANGLHPYFYYKKSQVIVTTCDEDGCTTTVSTQYLLTEAYTIQGHYQYHYQWETITIVGEKSTTTITKEVFKESQQILPNKWQRLEDWIEKEYKVNNNSKDITLARMAVWEAGNGFNEHKEWLDWLKQNNLSGSYVSQSSIPPELIPLFKEAEEKFGIPWWFLAAISFKESSFRIDADNRETNPNAKVICYGLMQVSDPNWRTYAPKLGFDPVLDRDNPRAQIFVGAYMLSELGFKNVNWRQGDWKEQTLPILTHYGGYAKVPDGKLYSSPEEWCRAEYAGVIWGYADKFNQGGTNWPVPGYTHILSHFGDTKSRKRPHQGIDIPAPMGASVVSASTGRVTFTGWENPKDHEQGYGLYITIRDQNHLYFYGHLSQIGVKVGQEVNIGDVIGGVGSTGHSSGNHLHFEVRDLSLGGSSGQAINPLLILN